MKLNTVLCLTLVFAASVYAQGEQTQDTDDAAQERDHRDDLPKTLEEQVNKLHKDIGAALNNFQKVHKNRPESIVMRKGVNSRMGVRYPAFIREEARVESSGETVSSIAFEFELIDQQTLDKKLRTITNSGATSDFNKLEIKYQFGCKLVEQKQFCVTDRKVSFKDLPTNADREKVRNAYKLYLIQLLRRIEEQTYAATTSGSMEVQSVLEWKF